MKVGFSGMWLHSGMGDKNSGLSRYAAALLDAMLPMAEGFEFDIYAPEAFEAPAAWAQSGRATLHSVPVGSLPKRVLWEHVKAAQIARRTGVDLWFSAAQGIPFGRGFKKAVMVHDMIPLLFPKLHPRRTVLYYGFALRHACRHADLVLANSAATKVDLVSKLGANASKVVVTPLGPGNRVEPVSAESVDPEQLRALGVRSERFVLTLCNLDYRKNLGRLVEAFGQVAASDQGRELGLVVVGAKRGTQHAPLMDAIARLGLEARVDLLGYVPDGALPALFASCELFAFPSLYEGFGLPILEAMALGAPVVCSGVSAMPEVGGDAARYFDPEDVDAMAGVLIGALRDAPGRAAMRAQGRKRATMFTWNRTARATLEAFSSTL